MEPEVVAELVVGLALFVERLVAVLTLELHRAERLVELVELSLLEALVADGAAELDLGVFIFFLLDGGGGVSFLEVLDQEASRREGVLALDAVPPGLGPLLPR